MKKKIETFNKKWANKSVIHCPYVFSHIRIATNKVFYSCNCISNVSNFPFFQANNNSFSFTEYIKGLDSLLTNNMNKKGICCECIHSQQTNIKPLTFENITQVTLDYFKSCNSNCVYCFAKKEGTNKNSETIKSFITDLINNNMINKSCIFKWGGGEPTILKHFNILYDFISNLNYKQYICTSGIKFSNTIIKALKNGDTVLISPDSGSKETFLKIKRTDKHDMVWKNIKKYAKTNGELYIKYVIFSLNSNNEEITKFIENCLKCNVKNVIIDCECYSNSGKFEFPAIISTKEIKAAKYLKSLCTKNSLKYSFGNYWTDEQVEEILSEGENK